MHHAVEKILVSQEEITKRCKELAKEICDDYRKQNQTPFPVRSPSPAIISARYKVFYGR